MPALADLLLPRIPLQHERGVLDEVRRRTFSTYQQLGIIREDRMSLRKYGLMQLELLAGLTYPDSDVIGLTLVNDFLLYAFYVDDQAEEDERYGKRPELLHRYFEGHLRALREGQVPADDDPAGRLLFHMRSRLLERASRAWLHRFADDVEAYLLWGTVGGARLWTDQTVPSVEDYVARRGTDSGAIVMQTLGEVAGAGELPAQVHEHPAFHELRRLCGDVVAFTNDLVSYPKEVRRQASPNNLVQVVMTHEGRTFESAQTRVIELVNACAAAFEQVARGVPEFEPETDARLRRYLGCQRAWMGGNLEWSMLTGRYQDAQHPFPELRGKHAPQPVRERALISSEQVRLTA